MCLFPSDSSSVSDIVTKVYFQQTVGSHLESGHNKCFFFLLGSCNTFAKNNPRCLPLCTLTGTACMRNSPSGAERGPCSLIGKLRRLRMQPPPGTDIDTDAPAYSDTGYSDNLDNSDTVGRSQLPKKVSL